MYWKWRGKKKTIIRSSYRYPPKEASITTPVTEPIETPEKVEIIQDPGTSTYIHPPQQYIVHTATSSITQITPQPISEIRHIINKVAAGTQTQPLGIANMDEIKTLMKNILT